MSQQPTTIKLFPSRAYEYLGRKLEREIKSGKYTARLTIDRGSIYGEERPFRTRITIPGRNEDAARKALARLESEYERYKIGLARNPFAKVTDQITFGQAADHYVELGCPKRDQKPRSGSQLEEEKRRVRNLRDYFERRIAASITQEDCDPYRRHRLKNLRKNSPGDRAVDMDLQTLSNIFRCACRHSRRTGITVNPFRNDRPRFQESTKIRHCRETMPRDAAELHDIATMLFQVPQSHVLGWQLLFEAFIGQRTHEILHLRWDAKNEQEAGFIQDQHLYLFRSSSSKGTYPFIQIHSALRQAIDALKHWHDLRYPTSPWFFPSPVDPQKPVGKKALTKALTRLCKILKIPHRTSHGLRAYHVNVLRSDRDKDGKPKLTDAEIGLRIGHKSGTKLIVGTYGEILPYRLEFLPATKSPAWSCFLQRPLQLTLGL